jgi:hypothetical protein
LNKEEFADDHCVLKRGDCICNNLEWHAHRQWRRTRVCYKHGGRLFLLRALAALSENLSKACIFAQVYYQEKIKDLG